MILLSSRIRPIVLLLIVAVACSLSFYPILSGIFTSKLYRSFILLIRHHAPFDLMRSFFFTLAYVTLTVAGQFFLGLSAVYFTFFSRNRLKFIVLYFVPYCIPLFLSTLGIRLSYDTHGFLTQLINSSGNKTASLLSENLLMFPLLVLTGIWQYFPFVFLFLFTMTLRINSNVIKAGILDGADNFTLFKKIILPNIKHVFISLIFLRILFMFNKYDLVVMLAKSDHPTANWLITIPLYIRDLHEQDGTIGSPIYALGILLFILFLLLNHFISKSLDSALR